MKQLLTKADTWDEPRAGTTPSGSWVSNRPQLLRLCLRFTRGNLSEAEDLLSDACLRALEARAQGVEVQSALAFSVTIIANLARDRRRAARHQRPAGPLSDSEGALASGEPAPDRLASARESLRLTLRALEAVPGRQRHALLLRSLGDDYSLIASEVGTTEQNARKLVQFARAAVQAVE